MRSIYGHLPSLLLIFFLLLNETQGIRLGNGVLKPVELLEKALEMEIPLVAEGFRKVTLCENLHCNSGKSRRLLSVTSPSYPTPSTTRNNEGNYKKGKEEISMKEKELNNNNSEASFIDIAEMDYSPATRKPPIHN